MKMIISSFYNTLINEEEAIPTSTMLEIDRVRNQGNLFVVVTNRLMQDVLYYNHDYPFIDYIISLNGSYVYDVNKQKSLLEKNLTKPIIKKVMQIFPHHNLLFYTKNNVYDKLVEEEILKIEIEVSKKELDRIHFLDTIPIYKSILEYNNSYYIEISPINSYIALQTLLDKKKLKTDDVVAVIGNTSEKEFIPNIPSTYVVSNSRKELKEQAHKTTKSNSKKGLECVLKKVK